MKNNKTSKEPLVSVLLSIYNVEQYIKECLDSILNQSYKNLEIICVDNASPDNCGKILAEYAYKDKRIKIVTLKQNIKLCGGRNTGLDNATGKYVCFVDPDDWIEKDNIKSMVTAIENNKDPDGNQYNLVVNFSAINFYNNGSKYYYERPDKLPCDQAMTIQEYNKDIRNDTHIPMWNRLYRRSFLEKTGIRFIDGFQTDNIPFTIKLMCHLKYWYTINRQNNPNANYWRRMANPAGALTDEVLFKNIEIPYCLINLYDYLVQHQHADKIKVPFHLFFNLCYPRHKDQPRYYERFKELMRKMEDDIKSHPDVYGQENINLCNLLLYTNGVFDFNSKYFVPKPLENYIYKNKLKVRLFNIITIFTKKEEKGRKVRYYFMGIPLWKIKTKNKTRIMYLFGLIPILKFIYKNS